jgi:hypothetical protein
VKFEVIGDIEQVETIAAGPSVKVRAFLRKVYGRGRWRKRKGMATVRLPNGNLRRVELHWYEAHGIGKRDVKIKTDLPGQIMKRQTTTFALCLKNTGNEASLILGKVYRVVPDARAAKDDLVRIIDESGEDYLFHKKQFVLVDFPQAVRKKILALQRAS